MIYIPPSAAESFSTAQPELISEGHNAAMRAEMETPFSVSTSTERNVLVACPRDIGGQPNALSDNSFFNRDPLLSNPNCQPDKQRYWVQKIAEPLPELSPTPKPSPATTATPAPGLAR